MIDLFFTIEGLVFYFLVLPFILYFLIVFIPYGIRQVIATVKMVIEHHQSFILVLQNFGAEMIRQFKNAFISKPNDLLDD